MFTSLEKRPSVPAVAPPSCHPPGSAGGPPLLSEALIGHRAPRAGRTLVALCWAAIGVLGVSGAWRGSSCYFPVTSLSFPGVHLLPTGPLPPVLPLSARVVFLRHNSSHLTCLLRAFPGVPRSPPLGSRLFRLCPHCCRHPAPSCPPLSSARHTAAACSHPELLRVPRMRPALQRPALQLRGPHRTSWSSDSPPGGSSAESSLGPSGEPPTAPAWPGTSDASFFSLSTWLPPPPDGKDPPPKQPG